MTQAPFSPGWSFPGIWGHLGLQGVAPGEVLVLPGGFLATPGGPRALIHLHPRIFRALKSREDGKGRSGGGLQDQLFTGLGEQGRK